MILQGGKDGSIIRWDLGTGEVSHSSQSPPHVDEPGRYLNGFLVAHQPGGELKAHGDGIGATITNAQVVVST